MLASIFILAVAGCNRTVSPPTPVPIQQLPAALDKAFTKAKPDAKDLAKQIGDLVRTQDYGRAFFAMQNLVAKPGLNDDQQEVATGGLLTLNTLMQEAQAKGDAKAAEALKYYRENK